MILNLENVVKKFDDTTVLSNINIKIEDKNAIAIIGPSGGGKSTLLSLISGYRAATSGDITINSHHLQNDERFLIEYRKGVGIVFQSYNLFPHLNAIKNITIVLEKVHKYSKKDSTERANVLLKQFGLFEHKNKLPIQMSGGQQQRLAIVRAMSYNPELLFFDEPSAALDPALTSEVLDVIKDLRDAGRSFIIVTHEMGFARQVADYVLFIDTGQIIEHGEPESIFVNPKTESLQKFLGNILEWR